MKQKKLLCFLLLIATLLSGVLSFPFPARAQSSLEKARDIMAQAAIDCKTSADLSSLLLPADQISALIDSLFETYPELFHLERSIQFSLTATDPSTVKEAVFTYRMDKESYAFAMNDIEKAVRRLIVDIPSGIGIAERLLWVHDKIVLNYQYDTTLAFSDAYRFFTQKKGTCNAYSMAFLMVCQKLGVEASFVSSRQMNHGWVRVRLDGNWYHIDLTADDPIPDAKGRVSHRFFLLSDQQLEAEGYTGFEKGFCTSDRYDSADWKNAGSSMVFYGNSWYYINDKTFSLNRIASLDSTASRVLSLDSLWSAENSGEYWDRAFSSLVLYNNLLYLNLSQSILSYQPDTSAKNTVLAPQLDPRESIYGLWITDGTIYYTVDTDPDGSDAAVMEYTIPVSREYTILFVADGKLFSTVTVGANQAIVAPSAIPTKPSTSRGSYEFIGWDGYTQGMRATSNRTFYAEFAFIPSASTNARPSSSATNPSASSGLPPFGTEPPESSWLDPDFSKNNDDPASSTLPPASVSYSYETPPSQNDPTDARPTHSHKFPQITTQPQESIAPTASITIPQESKDYSPPKNTPLIAWTFAVIGSVIVVGTMVLRERGILPKRKKQTSVSPSSENKKDSDADQTNKDQ